MAAKPKNTGFRAKENPEQAGFSFWERKAWLNDLDALVVGTGVVGTNAALRLREQHPHWRIAMVERSTFGSSTTRNAGFACFGSPSELLDDLNSLGAEAMTDLVRLRWEGLKLLREMWGDGPLGYRPCGAVEAFTDPKLYQSCLDMLPILNDQLRLVFGKDAFHVEAQPEGTKGLLGGIRSPLEGDLDTSKLTLLLRRALADQHIPCLSGINVVGLEPRHGQWQVHTEIGSTVVPNVFIASNAWAAELLEVDVTPRANQVIVSQPLPGLNLVNTLHHDRGYVYAREIDGRLLIGGGRQWSCDTEEERVERLLDWAQTHITGAEAFRIEHRWVGQLGVGQHRRPLIQQVAPGLFAGVRLGGMGVAIGSLVGRKLADLL